MTAASPARPRLFCGSFPALEVAFQDEIRTLRADDPLAPVAVIAPTRLLRTSLPRNLARAQLPHANLHFLGLRDLAANLLDSPRPLAPPPMTELLAGDVAENAAGDLQYFRQAASQEGFRQALLATIRDLREGGLTPADLRARSNASPKWTDLALLWERYETRLTELGMTDEAGRLQRATDAANGHPWLHDLARLVVYGFYDLNCRQWSLLRACLDERGATVYFPYEENEAYRYAKPTRDRLRSLVDRAVMLPPVATQTEIALVSAPGEARECAEVVRETLFPPADERVASVGILLRNPSVYGQLLLEQFRAAEVEAYFSRALPLRRTPAGRALLRMARLVGSDMKREDVIDLTTAAPLAPVELPDEQVEAAPATWRTIARQAGIVAGSEQWRSGLSRLARRWRFERESRDLESDPPEPMAIRPETALTAFRAFLDTLFAGLENCAAQTTWPAYVDTLTALYSRLFTLDDIGGEQALAVTEGLRILEQTGVPPSPERGAAILETELERCAPPAGRYEGAVTAVLPLMEARGLVFDQVIVPGLVEKSFPAPPAQDPLLLDRERALLNRTVENRGAWLPLKSARREEESLLFALCRQAARKRLVLLYPRLEMNSARPRVPSHFLLPVLAELGAPQPTLSALERFMRTDSRARHAPLNAMRAATPRRALHPMEFDLVHFAANMAEQPVALLRALADNSVFARALRAEAARYATPEFTAYDGVLGQDALAAADLECPEVFSATRLEDYAGCPFRYFAGRVLELPVLEEPPPDEALNAAARGRLYHEIYRAFLQDCAARNALPPGEADRPRLEALAQEKFEEVERRGEHGPPLLWALAKEVILADLQRFLENESLDESACLPALFELPFGMPDESGQSTATPRLEECGIAFRGRIDRIDLDPSARRARLLDYKTGGVPSGPVDLGGGQTLQLPVYLLGAETLLDGYTVEEASYYYASTRGGWKRKTLDRSAWEKKRETFAEIVRAIVDGIRQGRHWAYPDENRCRYCPYLRACGHGRLLQWKWALDLSQTAAYRDMRARR